MNKIIFSILLFFSFFGSADPVDTGHARISLIKDHSDFVPGTSINMGLKVSMDKGWHTSVSYTHLTLPTTPYV